MHWESRPWAAQILALDYLEDQVWVVGELTEVHPYDSNDEKRLELRIDGSLMLSVPDPGQELTIGETVYAFGKGFGYSVRGAAVGDVLTHYKTAVQEQAEWQENRRLEEARKLLVWQENLPTYMADLNGLHEPFKNRIEFFMRDTNWGPQYGAYEMFVCKEAIKIASHCKTADSVKALQSSSWEEQSKVIDANHSGNTAGAAFTLAYLFLTDAGVVPKMHGALCPLVGCKAYGCFASTTQDEATA